MRPDWALGGGVYGTCFIAKNRIARSCDETIFKITICSGSILCFDTAYAAVVVNPDDTRTFLGPTLRPGFTNAINYTSHSVAGEVAPKIYAHRWYFGMVIDSNQRIKFGRISLARYHL